MALSEKDLQGYLSSYFFGEAEGARLIEGLLPFSPGKEESEWIKIWAAEENYHHKLWSELVAKRGIRVTRMGAGIQNIFDLTDNYVRAHDWTGSMVGASIIEHISTAVAFFLYPHSDSDMKAILKRISGDDVGHLNFSLQQLKRIAGTPEGRKEILEKHKPYLEEVLEWPDRPDLFEGELETLNDAYQLERHKMGKLGVRLPDVHFDRSLSFKVKRALLHAFF